MGTALGMMGALCGILLILRLVYTRTRYQSGTRRFLCCFGCGRRNSDSCTTLLDNLVDFGSRYLYLFVRLKVSFRVDGEDTDFHRSSLGQVRTSLWPRLSAVSTPSRPCSPHRDVSCAVLEMGHQALQQKTAPR